MKKYNNRKRLLFLLILGLGIGFAYLSTQLNINGATNVLGSKWSVYFDNIVVSEGSMEAELPTIDTNKTTVDFGVTLANPGDYYEFTVDVVNDGTIDAMIESISKTSLEARVLQYLNYTVTYNDGKSIEQNDVLEAKDKTTYKVRVEFKKDVSASDLDENGVSLDLSFTANYVQSNKKRTRAFVQLVKDNALSDSTINFNQASSDTNGKGLYLLSGTENDENPIYYYRGEIDNNNAMFAGFCWKIVRTTETGGVKLIYSGIPNNIYKNVRKIESGSYQNVANDENYPFTFNEENKEWINSTPTNGNEAILSFNVPEGGDYFLDYKITRDSGGIEFVAYKNTLSYEDEMDFHYSDEGTLDLYNLTPSDVIYVKYRNYNSTENNDNVVFYLSKGVGTPTLGCTIQTKDAVQINKEIDNNGKFNETADSLAYNGYMYGDIYTSQSTVIDSNSNYLYGSSFNYNNGTYTLVNTNSTVGDSYHYTCLNTSGECSQLAYVYYKYYQRIYYIILTDGKSVENALTEMQKNENNSYIKSKVDNWFRNTFMTYFTSKNKDYNDYLEDTIWCNDRSMNSTSGWTTTGRISQVSYYESINRNNPTLSCPNKNDAFTVNDTVNGNGALTYPVGLITLDEIKLAGGGTYNISYYLYSQRMMWTMSPYDFKEGYANNIAIDYGGYTMESNVNNSRGIRPSISVASNVKVSTSGNGTSTNPYEFIVE